MASRGESSFKRHTPPNYEPEPLRGQLSLNITTYGFYGSFLIRADDETHGDLRVQAEQGADPVRVKSIAELAIRETEKPVE